MPASSSSMQRRRGRGLRLVEVVPSTCSETQRSRAARGYLHPLPCLKRGTPHCWALALSVEGWHRRNSAASRVVRRSGIGGPVGRQTACRSTGKRIQALLDLHPLEPVGHPLPGGDGNRGQYAFLGHLTDPPGGEPKKLGDLLHGHQLWKWLALCPVHLSGHIAGSLPACQGKNVYFQKKD